MRRRGRLRGPSRSPVPPQTLSREPRGGRQRPGATATGHPHTLCGYRPLHLRAPEVSGSRAATTRPRFVVAFRLVATSKGKRQRLRRRDNLQVRSRQLEGVVGRRRPLLLIGLGLVVGLALWMKLVGMEATARGGAACAWTRRRASG